MKDVDMNSIMEALAAAAEALEDLGACDDPGCQDENCNHALAKVRIVIAEHRSLKPGSPPL